MAHATRRRAGTAGQYLRRVFAPAIMALIVYGGSGCVSHPRDSSNSEAGVVRTGTFSVNGGEIVGLELLQADGRPFAYVLRAKHGLVVCPHFDLKGLESAGIAAAGARKWKYIGFEGVLAGKIESVNDVAARNGVTVGMTVRDALAIMMKEAPTLMPEKAQRRGTE